MRQARRAPVRRSAEYSYNTGGFWHSEIKVRGSDEDLLAPKNLRIFIGPAEINEAINGGVDLGARAFAELTAGRTGRFSARVRAARFWSISAGAIKDLAAQIGRLLATVKSAARGDDSVAQVFAEAVAVIIEVVSPLGDFAGR